VNGEQAIKMQKVGAKIGFINNHKQLPAPFILYADFEAITGKISKCHLADYEYYTNAYQDHEDCGYVGYTKLFVVMMVSSANQ